MLWRLRGTDAGREPLPGKALNPFVGRRSPVDERLPHRVVVFRGGQARDGSRNCIEDPASELVGMIVGRLPPRVGNVRNQTQRDMEEIANDAEPLCPFLWPRRANDEPGEGLRDHAGVEAQPAAPNGAAILALPERAAP